MDWQRGVPSEPGAYWTFNEAAGLDILWVRIVHLPDGKMVAEAVLSGSYEPLDEIWFQGPLVQPEPPE